MANKIDYNKEKEFIDKLVDMLPDIFIRLYKEDRIENLDISDNLKIWEIFKRENQMNKICYNVFNVEHNWGSPPKHIRRFKFSEKVENFIIEYYTDNATKFTAFFNRIIYGEFPIEYDSSIEIIKREIKRNLYKSNGLVQKAFWMSRIFDDKYDFFNTICSEFMKHKTESSQLKFIRDNMDRHIKDLNFLQSSYLINCNGKEGSTKQIVCNEIEKSILKQIKAYVLNYFSYYFNAIVTVKPNIHLAIQNFLKENVSIKGKNSKYITPLTCDIDIGKHSILYNEFKNKIEENILSAPYITNEDVRNNLKLIYNI